MPPRLWVDVYAPKTLDDYVWPSDECKRIVHEWIDNGATDNVMLSGQHGVGKSTLIRLIMEALGVSEADRLRKNASKSTSIDVIREDIADFINTGGFTSRYKYVILEEADGLSIKAQRALKDEMEQYSQTVRWILTSNHKSKIDPGIRDRLVEIDFKTPDITEIGDKLFTIADAEGINLDDNSIEQISFIVKSTYPSLRAAIRLLQVSTKDKSIRIPDDADKLDWLESAIKLFEQGKIKQARDVIITKALSNDYEMLWRWVYDNVTLFKEPDTALVILGQGYRAHAHVADPEINFSATLTEIAMNMS